MKYIAKHVVELFVGRSGAKKFEIPAS